MLMEDIMLMMSLSNNFLLHDQIIFKYCDQNGTLTEDANINGSLKNIAGICNRGRNVYGMMPHPERASEDVLGNSDGLIMFQSMIRRLAQRKVLAS